MNSRQVDGKYLDTSFLMEEDFEKEIEVFLKKQCRMRGGRIMPLWDTEEHEAIYIPPNEQEFHIQNEENLWRKIERQALEAKTPFDPKH